MITTRPATPADARNMADLLNEVIRAGGTTAHQRPFDADRMLHHYIAPEGLVACTVAESSDNIAGFQCLIWPNGHEDQFPEGWTIIATFVRIGESGKGIGALLFAATRSAAKVAAVRTIDATIRADNTGGLQYYEKMGFRDYDLLRAVPLRDGTPIDRVRKRYDLV